MDTIKRENKCVTKICLHQFCYNCLKKWLQIKGSCPLCKTEINSILYNIKSENEFEEEFFTHNQRNELSNNDDDDDGENGEQDQSDLSEGEIMSIESDSADDHNTSSTSEIWNSYENGDVIELSDDDVENEHSISDENFNYEETDEDVFYILSSSESSRSFEDSIDEL